MKPNPIYAKILKLVLYLQLNGILRNRDDEISFVKMLKEKGLYEYMLNNIFEILWSVPAVLIAITVHEYAHGFIAYYYGDPTAKLAGRLTLNPIAHLDPVGTLMLIIFRIGWAKPVPINYGNLRNPKKI